MAVIQRRMPGARMGREGAVYSQQFVINTSASNDCDLGFQGIHNFNPAFTSAPRVISAVATDTSAAVQATATAIAVTVCASKATTVRVTIVPQ